jgi:type IV pilus assembly protein PilB
MLPNINPADIDALVYTQKDKNIGLVKALLKQNLISEQDLLVLLMRELHLPSIDLTKYRFDERLKKFIGEKIARQYQVMPLSLLGNTLTVAISDPLNLFVLDDLRHLTGKEVDMVIASESQIARAIDQFYVSAVEAMAQATQNLEAADFEVVQNAVQEQDNHRMVSKHR